MSCDYLDWKSDLSAEEVFAAKEPFAFPSLWKDGVVYLSSDSNNESRTTLYYRQFAETDSLELIPSGFSLRTRINEMGGRPYWLFGDELVFVNESDQCLYRISIPNTTCVPQQLTKEPDQAGALRYGDVCKVDDSAWLAIVEEMAPEYDENQFYVALIEMADGHADPKWPKRLKSNSDFFANLVVNGSKTQAAWIEWRHPNMPWDGAELWLADVRTTQSESNELCHLRKVDMPGSSAVCQLCFAENGYLYFAVDFADSDEDSYLNYWNLWRVDPEHDQPKAAAITKEKLELGYPHWQFGDARIAQLDVDHLVAIATYRDKDRVLKIDLNTGSIAKFDSDLIYAQSLASDQNGRAVVLAGYFDQALAIELLTSKKRSSEKVIQSECGLGAKDISVPCHIEYSSLDAASSYAFYYPPKNSGRFNDGNDQLPPLIAMVHGGPTARAYGVFDLQKQFWTQRGFALVDVNHRGSIGYGRRFRDSLYGQWGLADCEDIAAAIDYLIDAKLVDPKRVVIRGKSAGGYAVLRALTEKPEYFSAGACYYGIGNLATLAEITHKFEAHYTDRLVGEQYNPEQIGSTASEFYIRSPINFIDQIQSPMIIFQGAKDRIVPPRLAHEMVAELKKKNLGYEYHEYSEEGHGFRAPNTNCDAWEKELSFYYRNLSNEFN